MMDVKSRKVGVTSTHVDASPLPAAGEGQGEGAAIATLDPALNLLPETVRHIHLMGICGTGMAALAGMLKASGFLVTGSDADVYPPMSDFLAAATIEVRKGYSGQNLVPRPDLVVVGNVITRKNPEALALAAAGLPYVSFPQALGHYFLTGKTPLVIAGTHGKTTTSSLLASILHESDLAPGFMIGGIVQGFGRNFNLGAGPYFVVEGDEYDTAFFDKGPKFLHYQPRIAVITSIEFDHADIYQDLEAIKKSFKRLVEIMPADGCLIACLDDPVVAGIANAAPCPVEGYGNDTGRQWHLIEVAVTGAGTTFSVARQGKPFGRFFIPMPGRHNALNSLAVIAVLDRLGVATEVIAQGLANFKGVRRRQEVRGERRGITVIDDFAHHPTAVRETLAALRAAYQGRRLIAIFEPRTNSSRRKVFQQDYVSAFDSADQVIVKEPVALTTIPEDERFSAPRLAADLLDRGIPAHCFAATDEIIEYLAENGREGDVMAILSNGGFDNIHVRLLARLAASY